VQFKQSQCVVISKPKQISLQQPIKLFTTDVCLPKTSWKADPRKLFHSLWLAAAKDRSKNCCRSTWQHKSSSRQSNLV